MSFMKPKMPTPQPLPPMAFPAQQASGGSAQSDNPLRGAFSAFRMAPELSGFAPRRAGRRSLIGG
jgi:hypothetical protein